MINWIIGVTGWSKAAVLCGVVAACLLAVGVAKCQYDKNLIENHEARVAVEINKKAREADQKAADQRIKDALENEQNRKDYEEVIKGSPDPRVALACERLRRAGWTEDRLPAPCRP